MNERQERDHAGTQIVGTVLDEASSFDRIIQYWYCVAVVSANRAV
jgi:hypothetical protein